MRIYYIIIIYIDIYCNSDKGRCSSEDPAWHARSESETCRALLCLSHGVPSGKETSDPTHMRDPV